MDERRWHPGEEPVRLPENCAVRLIDLDPAVDGLLAVDESGFANIYLNARLSREAQRKALRHELNHYRRGDLYSKADIRGVERRAGQPTRPALLAVDGSPLPDSAAFKPGELRRVGRGLYLPTGENRRRVEADLKALEALLLEAVRTFDALQTPPLFPIHRPRALVGGLCCEVVAFLAFQPVARQSALPVAVQLFREPEDRLRGAVYYDARGSMDDALITVEAGDRPDLRLCFDFRRSRDGGCLHLCGILRESCAGIDQMYGK